MTYNTYQANNITPIRTPYHELGRGAPIVPKWATHRSVYRAAGRTLYLVKTDSLDVARGDLAMLSQRGWDVHIDQDKSPSIDNKSAANISLSRKAA